MNILTKRLKGEAVVVTGPGDFEKGMERIEHTAGTTIRR
jgi:hypothetical protein